ncbi:unnamed protein product [Polarella glacialis]|uniref:Uncharacterized protein n=1 Tax=Polarella glacialis TaxID=89957 RepID=A0A813KAJ3_POLGL|nr:unnamed protein product [Polarella glacialis]
MDGFRKLSIVAKGMHLFNLMQPVAAGTSLGRRAVAAGRSLLWQQLRLATASADSSVQRVEQDNSQVTSELWQREFQNKHAAMSIRCQDRGRVSETTQVTEMSSRPSHFCKGKIRYSTLEVRNNMLEFISKRFANKYDTSEMTLQWWQANVTGSLSKLDITCRDCGYRVRTTTFNSLQQGRGFGCFCAGCVRWSTLAGHQRMLDLIAKRWGNKYDASTMTWAWWQDNIHGSLSRLDVTCRDCGYCAKTTRIRDFQEARVFSCFCNGGVSWSTAEGFHRIISLIGRKFGDKYNTSRMTLKWWQENIQTACGRLDVTCRDCGHHTQTTSIQSIAAGAGFGCFCSGAIRWASAEGHRRFLELIVERYMDKCDASRMTSDWWQASIRDAHSKVDITCKTCNHRNTTSTIGTLRQGSFFACLCKGGIRWSTAEGHGRMLRLISERFGDKYDTSTMSWAWWQSHVTRADSKLIVTCRDCRHCSKNTRIKSVQQGQGFGCLCRNKTEAKLLEWLGESYGVGTVSWQVQGCLNPATGRTLPFDFGLFDSHVLIELDGDIGHFGEGWPGCPLGDRGVPERDLFKEQWAVETGRVVIRLLQQDVLKDSIDWRAFLQDTVAAAVAARRPRVITQDSPKYHAGRYYELRFGNSSNKPQAGPHPIQIPSSKAPPRPL